MISPLGEGETPPVFLVAEIAGFRRVSAENIQESRKRVPSPSGKARTIESMTAVRCEARGARVREKTSAHQSSLRSARDTTFTISISPKTARNQGFSPNLLIFLRLQRPKPEKLPIFPLYRDPFPGKHGSVRITEAEMRGKLPL